MKIKFSFLIVLLCFLLAINQMFTYFIVYLFCLILHEYTHILTAKKLGYSTGAVYLTPFGATVKVDSDSFLSNHELIIALSAPMLNLLLLITTISCWWIWPQTYYYTYNFATANFALCFFNLLPIYPLDGSKILCYFLNKKTNKTKYVIISINVLFCIIFFVLSIICNNISYTIMSFLFMLSLCEKQTIFSCALTQTDPSSAKLNLNTIVVIQNMQQYKLNKMLKPNTLNRFFIIDNNLKVKKIIYQNQLVQLFAEYPVQTYLKDIK